MELLESGMEDLLTIKLTEPHSCKKDDVLLNEKQISVVSAIDETKKMALQLAIQDISKPAMILAVEVLENVATSYQGKVLKTNLNIVLELNFFVLKKQKRI
jgi:hypothetical protein